MSAQYISYVVYTIKSKSNGEFTENILASITETKKKVSSIPLIVHVVVWITFFFFFLEPRVADNKYSMPILYIFKYNVQCSEVWSCVSGS